MYKITNKIRLIELFAGVGSQAMALRNIGADFVETWMR
jgi:DNA (cytosine-5)-methyltransferase 1